MFALLYLRCWQFVYAIVYTSYWTWNIFINWHSYKSQLISAELFKSTFYRSKKLCAIVLYSKFVWWTLSQGKCVTFGMRWLFINLITLPLKHVCDQVVSSIFIKSFLLLELCTSKNYLSAINLGIMGTSHLYLSRNRCIMHIYDETRYLSFLQERALKVESLTKIMVAFHSYHQCNNTRLDLSGKVYMLWTCTRLKFPNVHSILRFMCWVNTSDKYIWINLKIAVVTLLDSSLTV